MTCRCGQRPTCAAASRGEQADAPVRYRVPACALRKRGRERRAAGVGAGRYRHRSQAIRTPGGLQPSRAGRWKRGSRFMSSLPVLVSHTVSLCGQT